MSARKSSHRTIFLVVSSGSPLALIASSLRSTSKKPVCPMPRSLHPPMAHCRQRVRFAATRREEFFEVPMSSSLSRRTLIKSAAGSAVLAGVGMPAIMRAQADAIRIGHLTPLTGFLGPLGEYAVMGVKRAADEINDVAA